MVAVRMVAVLATLAVLHGCAAFCATGYHPQDWAGGYSEMQLDDAVWQVEFDGNGYTHPQRAADFALLRSAHIAARNGFRYFIIVDRARSTTASTYTTAAVTEIQSHGDGSATATTTGGQRYVIQAPSASNTIVCFKQHPDAPPGTVYDAQKVVDAIGRKYGLFE